MRIYYHKDFKKRFLKLSNKLAEKVEAAITNFEKNPFEPRLRNHALTGHLADKRAFWVTGDIRVVFKEYDEYVVVIMPS